MEVSEVQLRKLHQKPYHKRRTNGNASLLVRKSRKTLLIHSKAVVRDLRPIIRYWKSVREKRKRNVVSERNVGIHKAGE